MAVYPAIYLAKQEHLYNLLCSNYVPYYVSQYTPQIQHFLSLILLKSQNHEYQQSLFIYFPITVQLHLSSELLNVC